MTTKWSYLLVFTLIFKALTAEAHYYDTLPKGVRLMGYRHVRTGEIKSNFDENGYDRNIGFSVDANSETLSGINTAIDGIIGALAGAGGSNPSIGSFNISGSSNVEVNGYGFGYGITNKFTAFFSVPRYKASVDIEVKRTQNSNLNNVADNILNTPDGDYSTLLGNMVNYFSDPANNTQFLGEITQGIFVNNMGYEHIGDWQAEGLGDVEVGSLYRLYKDSKKGLAVGGGLVLPTGRVDDPDILQDFGFGDGQIDLYAEVGGGYSLAHNLHINTFTRYDYQMVGQREFRLPVTEDGLTYADRKKNTRFKLGNKIRYHIDTEYVMSDWISLNAGYDYTYTGKSKFFSAEAEANRILALKTETERHELYASAALSSITPFLKKNFVLPAKIEFIYRTTVGGKNTAKVDRIELDFRMLF